MARIAIITRPEPGSPRVLAECLHRAIGAAGRESQIFFKTGALKRLLRHEEVKERCGWLTWTAFKGAHWISDWFFFRSLRGFDALVVSDCIPLAFYKDSYSIERLKKRAAIPVMIYEVYYLGNAPTIVAELEQNGHSGIDRYDWHLAVSEVTEIRQTPGYPWSQVGLFLKGTGLQPNEKKALLAIVDFARPGHEAIRGAQIRALKELEIPYVSLERKYAISEIRALYQQATFYFMQSLEAFGVPIAECLSCGCLVFTPDSSWPMSWRLDQHPQVHGPGTLSPCFVVYRDREDLKAKLLEIKACYDGRTTPQEVFRTFLRDYPSFYEGNMEALEEILTKVENKELMKRSSTW